MTNQFTGQGDRAIGDYRELMSMVTEELDRPDHYTCSATTAAAVNTALLLGLPLLLTGEPGCGKSRLAYRAHWELQFPQKLIKFVIKSSTEARDLFYTYDTVGRFYAAQMANRGQGSVKDEPEKFVHFQALGLAILRAKGRKKIREDKILNPLCAKENFLELVPNEEPERSVVLLDEIDKAPREVPNDILVEIEQMQFDVPELGISSPIKLEVGDPKPLVFITSNSERDLPEAFMRRCLYHHMEFPLFEGELENGEFAAHACGRKQTVTTVESVVTRRFYQRFAPHAPLIADALDLCRYLRAEAGSVRGPSLAEIIQFLDYLYKHYGRDGKNPDEGLSGRLYDQEQTQLEAMVAQNLLKIRDGKQIRELVAQWTSKQNP